jgi:hypothetical protein
VSAVQHVHWSIHKAFTSYQDAAERRRQLAAETGELAGDLITTLLGAGWSEHDAREAVRPRPRPAVRHG